MKSVNWTQVGVFAIIVLLVFLIGISLLGGLGGYGYGVMGARYGMMGSGAAFAHPCGVGLGGWGFPIAGWLGIISMWILPLGFLALLVAGIVWLVRAASGSSH